MKKKFFKPETKARIKKKDLVVVSSLSEIGNLRADQFVVVPVFSAIGDFGSSRKYMKHAEEVRIKRHRSMTEAIRDGRTPVKLREEAFDAINGEDFCGYSFMPFGRDRRKRKVALTSCLEGARIFAYANQVRLSGIDVKPYADARRVRTEGAEVTASVPSRTKGERKYKLKLREVPMADSPEKYAIAFNLGSDHNCEAKRFNIRYRFSDDKESSGVLNLCPHEIALYMQLVQQEWEQNKNVVPLQMSPFAIPSQKTIDYYLTLENNVLVKDGSAKDGLRKPNLAEKEIALWSYVKQHGHDETFYSKASRDGNLAEANWKR